MKIALDFDGTLAATDELILALMNWRLGTKYTRDDWTDWDFWRKMGPDIDKAFWGAFDLMDSTYLRRAIRPTDPFAPGVVKWLMDRGHTVHLVTANKERGIPSFEGWLWAHGVEMPIVTVNRGEKDLRKIDLDYDLYIDDNPRMVEEIKEFPGKMLILFRRPLNRHIVRPYGDNVVVADGWLDVKRILEDMGA